MIILFDENETLFSGLGLGVLRDAISCTVTESLNDEYTLAMEYPVKGNIFSQLQLNRIIYCRPNPYSSAQPFRIYSITKPLDGKVSVAAYHISYDMNDVPVGTINGQNIQDTLNQIQNGVIIDSCPFKLYTDMTSTKKFKTTSPYNMRALLMGSDDSILEKYDAEVRFDKWNAYIAKQRGKNRGVQVRYAKNMTELSHELNYERLYNGVYPFYHKETTSTTSTTTTGDFKQVYIVGKKPYQAGWLAYSAGGTAYQPVDESPVQIASDGDWKDKVYCWDSVTQRYVEKLYNQTVTLVQGVISPDWIKIDWGSLPNIVCKAAADGYFKTTTDTTWTHHASGETVFEGSITDISGLASNMILYYSEVIPSDSTSSADTDTSITHVELPEKIIWLDTEDAKAMKRDRILMLDLSSEFGDDEEDDDEDDEDGDTSTSTTTTTTTGEDSSDSDDDDDSDVPTVDELRAKAEKYIKKNKIGTIKFETSLSFVDLSSTTEKEKYKDFEQIELGDTVKVVYNELGININLRVITTEYDVLKNAYEQVELGEKSDTLSANSVQNGDDISSLTNDSDYASTSTVSKLIAKTVTADYIQAQNAKLTSAQITELSTARIKCTGILEASQLELDKLVATMLIADDAEIANTLAAGQIKVAGDISVNSGQISITNGEKVFSVTREGDVTANSVTITGGSLNINNGTFEVTNDGILTAVGADISGTIQATDGVIGGFTIGETAIYNSITGMEDPTSNGVYLGIDGIKLGNQFTVTSEGVVSIKSGTLTIGDNFDVQSNGKLTAKNVAIIGGSLTIEDNFKVTQDGYLTAKNVTITDGTLNIGSNVFLVESNGYLEASNANIAGKITAKSGQIANWSIGSEDVGSTSTSYLYSLNHDSFSSTLDGIYLGDNGISIGSGTSISSDGLVSINRGAIRLGLQSEGDYRICYEDWDNDRGVYGESEFIYVGRMYYDGYNYGLWAKYEFSPADQEEDTHYRRLLNVYVDYDTDKLMDCKTGLEVTALNQNTVYPIAAVYVDDEDSNSVFSDNLSWKDDQYPVSYKVISSRKYNFIVNDSGHVEANDIAITGGELTIGDNFNVTNTGKITAKDITITGGSINVNDKFIVSSDGKLSATGADISGKITSIEGTIGPLTITSTKLSYSNNLYIDAAATASDWTTLKPGEEPDCSICGLSARFDDLLVSRYDSSSAKGEYYTYFDKSRGLVTNFISQDSTVENLQYYSQIPSIMLRNIPVMASFSDWGEGLSDSLKTQPSKTGDRCPKFAFAQILSVTSTGTTIKASTYNLTYIVHAVACCVNTLGYAYCKFTLSTRNTSITVHTNTSSGKAVCVFMLGY